MPLQQHRLWKGTKIRRPLHNSLCVKVFTLYSIDNAHSFPLKQIVALASLAYDKLTALQFTDLHHSVTDSDGQTKGNIIVVVQGHFIKVFLFYQHVETEWC